MLKSKESNATLSAVTDVSTLSEFFRLGSLALVQPKIVPIKIISSSLILKTIAPTIQYTQLPISFQKYRHCWTERKLSL
jgi:hypothetical protein